MLWTVTMTDDVDCPACKAPAQPSDDEALVLLWDMLAQLMGWTDECVTAWDSGSDEPSEIHGRHLVSNAICALDKTRHIVGREMP